MGTSAKGAWERSLIIQSRRAMKSRDQKDEGCLVGIRSRGNGSDRLPKVALQGRVERERTSQTTGR